MTKIKYEYENFQGQHLHGEVNLKKILRYWLPHFWVKITKIEVVNDEL